MPSAIVMEAPGSAEVLKWISVPDVAPGPGELKIRHTAVSVSYADLLHRSGQVALPLPAILGLGGVGVVEQVGENTAEFAVGDRVAYAMALGSYCQVRTLASALAVKLPDDVSDRSAAALFGRGLTARYLVRDVLPLRAGDPILVYAAAGGVGSLVCQWAAALGATVIGVVSTRRKTDYARQCGCTHVIVASEENVVARVVELTAGAKVAVVYDSIGKDTFLESLDCLRPRGLLVNYGRASGPVENFPLQLLGSKGSLMVTQTGLHSFIPTREALLAASADLFEAMRSGIVSRDVGKEFPLSEASTAHRLMEERRTTGSIILIA